MADALGRVPGQEGYDASSDSNNTDNGDGTFTDGQGNIIDQSGGLISSGTGPSQDNVGGSGYSSTDQSFGPSFSTNLGGNTVDTTTGQVVATPQSGGVAIDANGNATPPTSTSNPSQSPNPNQPQTPTQTQPQALNNSEAAAALGKMMQDMLSAIASGNVADLNERIRQFNATFGLDQQRFNESVRQYNQTFGLQEAGVTGTYQGSPTLAAQEVSGVLANGQLTEAARAARADEALRAQQAIASAQNDPFRQLEVEYGTATSPGALSLVNGASGSNGVNAVPKFGALNGSAQGTGALGLAESNLNAINGSGANNGTTSATNGSPTFGGILGPNMDVANNLATTYKSPSDVVARNYVTADQGTQRAIQSAISANTGLDMNTVDSQIKAQLPSPRASGPTFGIAQL